MEEGGIWQVATSSGRYSRGSKASTRKKMEYGGVKARFSPKFAIPKRGKRSDRDSYREDARCRPKAPRKESSKDHVKDVSNLIGRPVVITDRGLWATRTRRGGTSVIRATASKEGDSFLEISAKCAAIILRRHSLGWIRNRTSCQKGRKEM